MKLKICGMRDADNISEVAALNPDFMGFIFYPKSPRFVGKEFQLPTQLPSEIKRVGVFVNENVKAMLDQVKKIRLDYVQLHGDESVESCKELKEKGVGVIKVFSVDDNFDFKKTEPFKKVIDYFLFDTKGKLYGGNAQKFNWSILHRYDNEIPFFLSGGLTSEDINEVYSLAGMNIHALDVNSGVEVRAGVKSVELIKSFIKKLKH